MVLPVGNSAVHWVRDGQTCGTQVIPERMCCTAKEMGIKCLWTWGRHCTLGRMGSENLRVAHTVAEWW